MAYTPPTALTFEQKIIAAYLSLVCNVNQQYIAIAFGGINIGRVNEAIKTVEEALKNHTPEAKHAGQVFEDARQVRKENANGSGQDQSRQNIQPAASQGHQAGS